MVLHRIIGMVCLVGLLAACSTPKEPQQVNLNGNQYPCVYQPASSGGAFYKDDGPGNSMPANVDSILEPLPVSEPLHRFANRPYNVLGKNYAPLTAVSPFSQEGIGSWYGRKFHGQKTSSGERYDMYAMTAAHPTLPIPSYARVTNLDNGRSVVVRVNDRGPFHKDRVIDLSFLAACRLGYATRGSAPVKVEMIVPGKTTVIAGNKAVPARVEENTVATVAPLIEQPKGIFIQLGAFSSQLNAESFRSKVAETLNRPLEQILLQNTEGVFRVRMGPFVTREAAVAEVERLTGEHNIRAVVVH